ncbi:MAG: DUF4493 domain-containing protein [Rikenellaceae bacterium]
MKSIIKRFALLLAMLIGVVSCVDDAPYYTLDSDLAIEEDSGEVGYLSLSNMNVSLVQINEEVVDSTESEVEASTATRADEEGDDAEYRVLEPEELANCWLSITSTNLKDPVYYEMTFADFYAEASGEASEVGGYPLLPAQYEIIVDNVKPSDLLTESTKIVVNEAEAEDLGTPKYRGYGDFTIKSNVLTESTDDIKCDLNNVKVALELSADLKAMFKPESELEEDEIPLNVSVSMGYLSYVFDGSEPEDTSVYFDLLSVGKISDDDNNDTITIVLSGMFNTANGEEDPSYSKIEAWSQTITGVTAGQSRNIGIRIEHTNEGTVEFVIEVENWVYDDMINVDVMKAYANSLIEEVVIDPESLPRVLLLDGSDNVRFIAMEGDVSNLQYQFTPRDDSEIVSIKAVTSNLLNGEPMEWTPGSVDLGEFSSIFEASVNSINRKVTIAATDAGMETLREEASVYVTTFTVVDNYDRVSVEECTVNIGEATAPSVVWRDKDIYVRQEITAAGLDFIIDITSSTSITGFTVDIVSDVLSADELASTNLNSHMDLVNPDDSYAAGLATLGFPTGDAIYGKTEMVFDASSFMTALYAFGEGDSDFILTITNSAGKTTVATAGVYVGSTENPEFERPETGDVIISWDGYDFDTRYDISSTTYPTVVIDVEAAYGIASFVVNIDSEALTEADLTSLNLDTSMDLVSPATEDMASGLKTLGFLVKDDIRDQTSVQIDITQFMPILSLLGEGYSDFKLTVIDNNGSSASKTLMLNSIEPAKTDDDNNSEIDE